jgi:hypothetical protein
MQQATQIQQQPKSVTHVNPTPASAAGSSFVINLCSSTSPVALSPPDHAGLRRFTFFVSRRREEGRERFRLHMGYFETQEEAEKLLDIVREIYPGAWAGLAPGQRLRAAAAAAAASQAAPAPVEQEVPPAPAVSAAPASTVAAAPQAVVVPAPVAPPPAAIIKRAAEPIATNPKGVPDEVVSFQLLPDDRGRALPKAAMEQAPKAPASNATPEKSEQQAATRSLNDVRAAIASLDDSAAHAPVLRPPADLKIPELKPAVVQAAAKKPVEKPVVKVVEKTAAKPIEKPVEVVEELNDEAAMAVLEAPEGASAGTAGAAAPNAEKAVYAVQLIWSVQPIDISQVPQLAIFTAYTLYGAEGNRDGRRWYGLRLGFFTDAVSAKQVAHYVRSEFSTVSVVPVTVRERERARNASAPAINTAPLTASTSEKPAAKLAQPTNIVSSTKFEFIEDKAPARAADGTTAKVGATARPAPGPRTGRGAPGKRAKLRTPAQAASRAAKPKKLTLEETLEILGAGELKVDDGRKPLLDNESAANAAAPKPAAANKSKPSRLGRLFERLSERIGN